MGCPSCSMQKSNNIWKYTVYENLQHVYHTYIYNKMQYSIYYILLYMVLKKQYYNTHYQEYMICCKSDQT